MAKNIVYTIDMKKANIAELKNHLSKFIGAVESGEEIQVCRRNMPVALISPIPETPRNRTKLGCGRGSVTIHVDLTEPLIPEDSWLMLTEGPETESK